MIVRLAFLVAAHVGPEIVLIDEVLAVGDANFQEKCSKAIERLKHSGSMFICVSHGTAVLRRLCKRALWLEHGTLVRNGEIEDVLTAYGERRSKLGPL
jgi:ABC-type polysaccharide/polyol phosphate transport system ATPase subunit